jgi:integrase/recombinase XerD
MMLEELRRRHYSQATTQCYIRFVERFAQHFDSSPDRLGRQHIREDQAQLFTVQKLSPGTVTDHLCALRFLYIQTLKRPWSIADTPYPKKRYRLPTVLSQEEVAQLIDAAPTPFYRTILMTLYGTGVRRTERGSLPATGRIASKALVASLACVTRRTPIPAVLNGALRWKGVGHSASRPGASTTCHFGCGRFNSSNRRANSILLWTRENASAEAMAIRAPG